jgi:hypothetical protein
MLRKRDDEQAGRVSRDELNRCVGSKLNEVGGPEVPLVWQRYCLHIALICVFLSYKCDFLCSHLYYLYHVTHI